MADRERGVGNNLETAFNVGSINKVFTQIAILQLSAAGKINLDSTGKKATGVTYIDGRRLAEPYIAPARRDRDTKELIDIPPVGTMRRIPPRLYLVEGDNRAHSCDSRVWGLVPRANIIFGRHGMKLLDLTIAKLEKVG